MDRDEKQIDTKQHHFFVNVRPCNLLQSVNITSEQNMCLVSMHQLAASRMYSMFLVFGVAQWEGIAAAPADTGSNGNMHMLPRDITYTSTTALTPWIMRMCMSTYSHQEANTFEWVTLMCDCSGAESLQPWRSPICSGELRDEAGHGSYTASGTCCPRHSCGRCCSQLGRGSCSGCWWRRGVIHGLIRCPWCRRM